MFTESFLELQFFLDIFSNSYKKEYFSDRLTNYCMRQFNYNKDMDDRKRKYEKEHSDLDRAKSIE